MLLNRRTMLSASIGAIALSLSGCNKTITTIVFANNAAVPISVSATATGVTFSKRTIAPGHASSQVQRSNATLGSIIQITIYVTLQGMPALPPQTLPLTLGYRNTFEIDSFGVATVVVQ